MTTNGGTTAASGSGRPVDLTSTPPAQWPDPAAYGRVVFEQWCAVYTEHLADEGQVFQALNWLDKVLCSFQEAGMLQRADLTQAWREDGMTWPAVAEQAELSQRRVRELAPKARPLHLRYPRTKNGGVGAQEAQDQAAQGAQL